MDNYCAPEPAYMVAPLKKEPFMLMYPIGRVARVWLEQKWWFPKIMTRCPCLGVRTLRIKVY